MKKLILIFCLQVVFMNIQGMLFRIAYNVSIHKEPLLALAYASMTFYISYIISNKLVSKK